MPRPMPLPISVGTDICHAKRIFDRFLVAKPQLAIRFAKKILTPEEYSAHESKIEGAVQRWIKYYGTPLAQPPSWSTNWLQNNRLSRNAGVPELIDATMRTGFGNDSPNEEEKGIFHARNHMQKLALFLAGRFAAKEAIVKAHQSRRLTYWDIQITSPPSKGGMSQGPVAIIKPEGSEEWEDGQEVSVSISHDGEYATATSIVVDRDLFAKLVGAESPNIEA